MQKNFFMPPVTPLPPTPPPPQNNEKNCTTYRNFSYYFMNKCRPQDTVQQNKQGQKCVSIRKDKDKL